MATSLEAMEQYRTAIGLAAAYIPEAKRKSILLLIK